jgi:hypothetical protein
MVINCGKVGCDLNMSQVNFVGRMGEEAWWKKPEERVERGL